MSLARLILGCACVLMACGCTSAPTRISVRHDPPYRPEPHTSTVYVTAKSESGIVRIDVSALTGELTVCTQSSLSSLFPCRTSGSYLTYTCTFTDNVINQPAPKSATCPFVHGFGRLGIVTYQATVTDALGRATSTNMITYSGGEPPQSTLLAATAPVHNGGFQPPPTALPPPPPQPTAADVMRPIWLEAPQGYGYWPFGPFAGRLDVVFLPDADWGGDDRAFADATSAIVERVFFEPQFGNAVIPYTEDYQMWRRFFSLWAGPDGAGAATAPDICTRSFTGWADETRAITDGQAVVHQVSFRDCSFFGPGAWGTVTGEAGEAGYIFVHESGHFLHCMGDEYAGAGHHSCSDPPNTFQTRAACLQTAAQFGIPASWCVPVDAAWHITDGMSLEIMDNDWLSAGYGYNSTDWQDTAHQALLRHLTACLQGYC